MSFIESLCNFFKPRQLTPEQEKERHIRSTYRLKPDPDQPFTYWLNDSHLIRFNPHDLPSMLRAENAIQAYYRNPKIERAHRARTVRAPARKAYRDTWREVEELGAGLQDVADYFTEGIDFNPKNSGI